MTIWRFVVVWLVLVSPLAGQLPGSQRSVAGMPNVVGADALGACRDSTLAGSWGNGKVFKVTTLANSGDGSLRAILVDSIPAYPNKYKIVLGDTSGVVTLTSDLRVKGGDCWRLAGQSFPGGLAIRVDSTNSTVDVFLGDVDTGPFTESSWTHNTLIEYVHFYLDDHVSGGTNEQGGLNVRGGGDRNSVYRSSLYGGPDQTLSAVAGRGFDLDNTAVINSIIAPVFGGTGVIVQNGYSTTAGNVNGIAFAQNLFITRHRLPRWLSATTRAFADSTLNAWMTNNVIASWQTRAIEIASKLNQLDVRNNYFKALNPSYSVDTVMVRFDAVFESVPDTATVQIHFAGNMQNCAGTGPTTNETIWHVCTKYEATFNRVGVDSVTYKAAAGQDTTGMGLLTAQAAYNEIIGNRNVGAFQYLAANGTWVRNITAIDSIYKKAVADSSTTTILNGTSNPEQIWDVPGLAGDWPSLAPASGHTDTDGDGMWDAFESLHGVSDPWADPDGDRYTNIDEMLQGSDPNAYTATDGSEGGDPTFHPGTDTAFSVFRLIQRTVTIVTGGGADTLTIRRVSRDTIPLGTLFDVHPDCIAGDTVLVATKDSLIVGADTIVPLTAAQVDSLATAWGLPNTCTSENLKQRKVNGTLSAHLPIESQKSIMPLWAKPEWGLAA